MSGTRRPTFGSWILLGVLLTTFAMTAPTGATAQTCDNEDPEIELGLVDLGLSAVGIFYLSDFRPAAEGGAAPLFRFGVGNLGAGARELVLGLQLESESGPLFSAATDPFTVEGGQTLSGSNLDLASSGSMFEMSKLEMSDTADDLESLILQLGFLPAGIYSIRLNLTDPASDEELSACFITFTVNNPRAVDLILPGAPFVADLPAEGSPFPLFQWRSEAARFDFRLCPVLPGDASGEEVMGNEPIHEHLGIDTAFTGTHTWLYPPGAEPLVAGGRYCWQVEAIVPTSSGDITFSSEIFCFEMATTRAASGFDELLDLLSQILPPGTLDELAPRLEGFRSTGEVAVNGEALSPAEMMVLIRTLLSAGWQVGNPEIEE